MAGVGIVLGTDATHVVVDANLSHNIFSTSWTNCITTPGAVNVELLNNNCNAVELTSNTMIGPTALAGLPTCTATPASLSILGARALINNSQCNYAYGQTPVATTAANEKCTIGVFCGTYASATAAGTPVVGWIVGRNGQRIKATPWEMGEAYYPGSPISSKGWLER